MKTGLFCTLAAAVLAAGLALPDSAHAMGCNGIVNPTLAGCTRSDNNDGAGFPYSRLVKVAVPARAARIEMKQGTPMVQYQDRWMPILSANGGTIIAAGDGQ